MGKIKVRCRNGKLYDVKDASFVELCNDANMLLALVYISTEGNFHIHYPTDTQFQRYIHAYRRKPGEVQQLSREELDDAIQTTTGKSASS